MWKIFENKRHKCG